MMIFNRSKNCKSETPIRNIPHPQKITQLVGISKKSDPFLKQLRQAYDKENFNPNIKEQRVKSYNNKIEHVEGKSPNKRAPIVRQNKQSYQPTQNMIRPPKELDQLSSNSKYSHSTELQRGFQNTKSSNRKSTEKDDLVVSHFEEEYYTKKEDRRQKKMKVTLKDVKKHRKSIQQSEQDYSIKFQEQTKDSLTKEMIGSIKEDTLKSINIQGEMQKTKTQQSSILPFNHDEQQKQYRCLNHPQKRASHQLVQGDGTGNFCQKCAVNLVTKGHKMRQLHHETAGHLHHEIAGRLTTRQDEQKQQRLQKIKYFLIQVQKLQPLLRQVWNDISSYRSLVQNKFQNQTLLLKDYYNQIKKQVQESYKKSQMNLKMYFQSVAEELQKNEEALNKSFQQLKDFKWDILPNINSIVEQQRVAQQNFEQIIHSYYNNLKVIQLNIKDISQYNYCIYQYYYDTKNVTIPNIKDMIAPQIHVVTLRENAETVRKHSQNSSQKRLDPFRLSFGKKIPEISHRIL